jgi:Domain of unknown function (DU1801)
MAGLKTTRTEASVDEFLAGVADKQRRGDAGTVRELMERVTGERPAMWGDSIVGFGSRHLRYASGRELDWFVVGFSPRKQALTIYLSEGFEQREELLKRLGPYSTGRGCLYLKRLDKVDLQVLERLIKVSVESSPAADG